MARKREEKFRTEGNQAGQSMGRRVARYFMVMMLTGAVALAWLSMLTYSPTDPPSKAIFPPKNPVDNAAGIVGAYVAHSLR